MAKRQTREASKKPALKRLPGSNSSSQTWARGPNVESVETSDQIFAGPPSFNLPIKAASQNNPIATWGMWLGIVSIFLGPSVGLLPISAIIVSGIGLEKAKGYGSGKGKAVIGLILGCLFTLVYLNNYGYLGKL